MRPTSVALLLLAACGKEPQEDTFGMEIAYSIGRLAQEAEVAVAGSLGDVDRDAIEATLHVGRPLKGVCPHRKIRLRLKVSFAPYHDLLRRQLRDGAPVVFLYNGGTGLLYLNRFFVMGYFTSGDPPEGALWEASNLERRMNRTYNGDATSLAALLPQILAGERAGPAIQDAVPPIDTPSLRALPPPGEAVDEEYLPAPFRRARPVFRSALLRPAGLRLEYIEGFTGSQLDFDGRPSAKAEEVDGLDLSGHDPAQRYALRFRGSIRIPKDGEYSFRVSKGTARLRVAGAEEGVLDLALAAGFHAFELDYLGPGGTGALEVDWAGPGFARRPLDAELFKR